MFNIKTKLILYITVFFLVSFSFVSYAKAATEFVAVVDTGNGSGTDYTSLNAWETGVQTDLTAATTLVFAGTRTGTMADNASVAGATSGATATIVHATSSQILLENISGTFQNGEQIRVDISNYFTTSNTGDSAIAVAKCRASTGAADTTAVSIDGWTTSATNYIKVWTDPTEAYRHQGKWDTTKYRLETVDQSAIHISEDFVKIDGLQVKVTSSSAYSVAGFTSSGIAGGSHIWISNNIIVGVLGGATYGEGINMNYYDNLSDPTRTWDIWNNIIYGFNTSGSNGINGNSGGASFSVRIYNNTVYGCDGGIGGATGYILKNNISYNNATDYFWDPESSSTNNLSKDGTAPPYNAYYINKTVTFSDETNKDFHLAQSDTDAKNMGADLSAEITTDIDGSTRTGSWDIGADEAAIKVFYSVGQNTNDHSTGNGGATCSTTGACTLTIASGVATFNYPQTATNLGVGDKVTYNTSSIAYISEKISDTQWKLITATGTTPADVGTAQTVNSIAHPFSSLSAAENGADDASYLNASDLVAGNYQLNIPCYYDTGADTTAVTINGWTTGPANYIKIYTPNNTDTEVNLSQRHEGKWDDEKYKIEFGNSMGISIRVPDVVLEGLQLRFTTGAITGDKFAIEANLATGIANISIDSNIVKGMYRTSGVWMLGYADYYSTVGAGDIAPGVVRLTNNVFYDFTGASNGVGINGHEFYLYVYNNTVYNCWRGFYSYTASTIITKNSISYNNDDNYFGTFNASSTNNLSGPSTDSQIPSTNARNGVSVIFADEDNDDFRLSLSDTGAKDQGVDLANDTYLPFTTDVSNRTRSSVWDIGASEAGSVTMSSGDQQSEALTDGLVLYQSFDGDDISGTEAIDRSDNGNDGTISGATSIAGKRGQALNFDGNSNLVNENSPGLLDDIQEQQLAGGMSVSMWIKNENYTQAQPIIISKGNANSNGFWVLLLDNSGPEIRFMKDFGVSGWGDDLDVRADFPDSYLGQWKHVVLTWDGTLDASDVHFYIDASEISKTSEIDGTGSLVSDASLNLGIGCDAEGGGFCFDGSLDEVRVYNRVLSADEIASLYKLGEDKINVSQATNLDSGLVLSQSFDGKYMDWSQASAEARDASGNNYHGNVTGATSIIGKRGQALNFGGQVASADMIIVTNSTAFDFNDFTYAAWIKPDTISGWDAIMTTDYSETYLGLYNGQYAIWQRCGSVYLGHSTAANAWHHVAYVVSGTNYYFYEDGEFVTSGGGCSTSSDSDTLNIGARGDASNGFDGILDEVRAYSRALSADEVRDLYNMGKVEISK